MAGSAVRGIIVGALLLITEEALVTSKDPAAVTGLFSLPATFASYLIDPGKPIFTASSGNASAASSSGAPPTITPTATAPAGVPAPPSGTSSGTRNAPGFTPYTGDPKQSYAYT